MCENQLYEPRLLPGSNKILSIYLTSWKSKAVVQLIGHAVMHESLQAKNLPVLVQKN